VSPFGTTSSGEPAHLVTLTGDDGITVRIGDLGATLVEVHLPDRDGRLADVTLGFDHAAGYGSEDNKYFGATVGRVANRIAGASFELDGQTYRLAANEAPHAIHGGPDRALSKVLWEVVHADDHDVELTYTSPEGEEGYPGTLDATARYRLIGNELEVRYQATTDRRTPVNLTNHAYWNLAGAGNGTILDHELMVVAQRYTPTDDELIPTGEVAPVEGTPLDLTTPTRIGERIAELEPTGALGYDHNLVLDGEPGQVRLAARLRDPASGRGRRSCWRCTRSWGLPSPSFRRNAACWSRTTTPWATSPLATTSRYWAP
jgi:aldose 1-epimerase